jgi:3-keto-disaccharide hydrolase
MQKLIIFVAITLCFSQAQSQQPNKLTKEEKKQGWKLLFDGKTTQGWHTYLRDTVGSKWQVRDGAIIFDTSKPRNGGGDLVTNEAFENYELQLEWKISKGGNSGIIFDIQEDPKFPAAYLTGPEMQVLDNISASDNKKQSHLAGCLYDLAGDSTVSKPKPVGQFNKVKLVQNKGHLTLWLNDVQTFDGQIGSEDWNERIAKSKFVGKPFADFAKVAKGKIALQQHPGSSEWRNIKIRLL